MNIHEVKGKFNELKGNFKMKWGELTDDDWKQVSRSKDKLLGIFAAEIWPIERTGTAGSR